MHNVAVETMQQRTGGTGPVTALGPGQGRAGQGRAEQGRACDRFVEVLMGLLMVAL